jgi:hypothetical protein
VLVIVAGMGNVLWEQHAIFRYAAVAGGMGAVTKGSRGGLSTGRMCWDDTSEAHLLFSYP